MRYYKVLLAHFWPIFPFMPPENTRKKLQSPLTSSENLWFSDDFRGNRSYFVVFSGDIKWEHWLQMDFKKMELIFFSHKILVTNKPSGILTSHEITVAVSTIYEAIDFIWSIQSKHEWEQCRGHAKIWMLMGYSSGSWYGHRMYFQLRSCQLEQW